MTDVKFVPNVTPINADWLNDANDKLKDIVSVRDFGAKCDGVTDDSAAIQRAVNYCLSVPYARTLTVPGRCRVAQSIIIDRLVDGTSSEFRIIGKGPAAGFYTTDGTTIFDSLLTVTVDPRSEFLSFENLHFETSSVFNESYVVSKKFLRCKQINCNFRLIRYVKSDTYVQTLYFDLCNIRNTPANFIEANGLYDVSFTSCIIENGSTVVKSVSTNSRGTNGLRFVSCVIEGLQGSVAIINGATLQVQNCHLESNFLPMFNLFAGGPASSTVTCIGNYIYNPGGAGGVFYYGPTTSVISSGNTCSPNVMHVNVNAITNFTSISDNSTGGVADTALFAMGGVLSKQGDVHATTVTVDGDVGIGNAPIAGARTYIRGKGLSSATYALAIGNNNGLDIAWFKDDRSSKFFGPVGFNGATPQSPVTLPPNATDLSSAMTLVNAIKVALIANGICQ